MQTNLKKKCIDSLLKFIKDQGVGQQPDRIRDRWGGGINCSHTSKGKNSFKEEIEHLGSTLLDMHCAFDGCHHSKVARYPERRKIKLGVFISQSVKRVIDLRSYLVCGKPGIGILQTPLFSHEYFTDSECALWRDLLS